MAIADELTQRLSSQARVAASGTEDFADSDLRYTQYGRPVRMGSCLMLKRAILIDIRHILPQLCLQLNRMWWPS